MEKILISACLIGDKTRYDGKDNYCELVTKLNERFDLVPFCPEVEGGLKTPRKPAEIIRGYVKTEDGKDVTKNYQTGAEKALALCTFLSIKTAILKEASPSCGVHVIHDGSFTDKKVEGQGVTSALLASKGIRVYSEEDLPGFLADLEAKDARLQERMTIELAKEEAKASEEVAEEQTEKRHYERREAFQKRPQGRKKFCERKEGGLERKPFKKRDFEAKEGESGEKKSYGKKRLGKKPFGKKPFGDKKFGGKKFGGKPGAKGGFIKKSYIGKPTGKRHFGHSAKEE